MNPATKEDMKLIIKWYNSKHKLFWLNAWKMLKERDYRIEDRGIT